MTGDQLSDSFQSIKNSYSDHTARITRVFRDHNFGKLNDSEALRQLIYATNELVQNLKESREKQLKQTGNGSSGKVSKNSGKSS